MLHPPVIFLMYLRTVFCFKAVIYQLLLPLSIPTTIGSLVVHWLLHSMLLSLHTILLPLHLSTAQLRTTYLLPGCQDII